MNDCLPPDLIAAAMRLVGAVRDEGRDEVNAVMAGVDLRGLCVTLAAMVPDDRTPSELLEWNDLPKKPRSHHAEVPGPRLPQPCGTHAAFVRHKARGETVDPECVSAERKYQRERVRRSGLSVVA